MVTQMFRLIFPLLITLCSYSSIAAKPILHVVAEEWPGATNKDLTGKYWNIIRAVYGEDYDIHYEIVSWNRALTLFARQRSDIVVGVYQDQHEKIITSQFHLDMDESFYLLYNKSLHNVNSLKDINNLTIAGRTNYIVKSSLPSGIKFYPMSSLANVNKLIMNERVDGALLYAKELNTADPSKSLDHIELLPKQKMYLGYADTEKGKQLAKLYDEKMPELIKSGQAKTFFPSGLAYQFANYTPKLDKPTIDWFLIPKMYQERSKLHTLFLDHQFSDYVADKFNDFNFNLKIGSVRVVDAAIAHEPPLQSTCVVNVFKNPKRAEFALFSKPINSYIKPRLVTLKETQFPFSTKLSHQKPVDLDTLIDSNPSIRIGIVNKGFAHNIISKELDEQSFNKFIIFEDRSYSTIMSMLYANRLDAVIIWPTILPEIMSDEFDVNLLDSYSLPESVGRNFTTYLMCNNTPSNKKLITNFDRALSTPVEQKIMYGELLKRFDKQTAEIFKKELGLSIQ